MRLYHGSNQIVRQPALVTQERGLDFGSGFYTTTNLEQALRFAQVVVERESSGKGLVSCYEIDDALLPAALKILVFDAPDEDWLDFVEAHRLKKA